MDVASSRESEVIMAKSTINSSGSAGHRQRLRERFLAGESSACTEEALLELLLTYAIPQQDVAPLARALLHQFGDLAGVLAAEPSQLLEVKGIKESSTVLLKLVDTIRRTLAGDAFEEPRGRYVANGQSSLFDVPTETVAQEERPAVKALAAKATRKTPPPARPRSELFANATLKEAIELLPGAPLTDSLDEMKQFLRASLHFSAEQTRIRNANYIVQRMFPSGQPDRALLHFARHYAGRQELRDVCFYRFCVAEPLLFSLTDDLLLPAISAGSLDRARMHDYLLQRNPASKSIRDALKAIGLVYAASGIARSEKAGLRFAYRDILLPSFAFVLHSEFPAPGMYDIAKVEQNRAVRALLWNPDRILPALYELRNHGILTKVSEIDTVRQFTTRMTLEQAVDALPAIARKARRPTTPPANTLATCTR